MHMCAVLADIHGASHSQLPGRFLLVNLHHHIWLVLFERGTRQMEEEEGKKWVGWKSPSFLIFHPGSSLHVALEVRQALVVLRVKWLPHAAWELPIAGGVVDATVSS